MAVLPQSRYGQSTATITRVPNSAGDYQLTVYRSVPPVNVQFTLYIWKEFDRPDNVAAALLGNPNLWWAIFDINPEIIDPLHVPTGAVVRIPTAPVMGQGTLLI